MNTKWLILLIGIAGGASSAWWFTADHYQGVIAKEHEAQQELVIEQQEHNRLALLAYAERIVKAGADHDKNIRIVRNLSRELDGLRVNFPTCPLPRAAEGGGNSGGGTGALSDKLDDAFADLQKETSRLIERCDELNADAIRANSQIDPATSHR